MASETSALYLFGSRNVEGTKSNLEQGLADRPSLPASYHPACRQSKSRSLRLLQVVKTTRHGFADEQVPSSLHLPDFYQINLLILRSERRRYFG